MAIKLVKQEFVGLGFKWLRNSHAMQSSERKQTSNMGEMIKCSLLNSSIDTGASFLSEAEKINTEQISQSTSTAGE